MGSLRNRGCNNVVKSRPLETAGRSVNLLKLKISRYECSFPILRDNMIRERIQAAQVEAMKARDVQKTATIRLMMAAIKNRDIEARTGKAPADDDTLVVEVLQKMVKQRRESIEMFKQGGRQELADNEAAEVAVIETFLPQQLSEAETLALIEGIKTEVGAASVKDMGKVMALLKERHASALDMSKASGLVKAALS